MRKSFNNTLVERSYKNTSASETVNVNAIDPPFKVIDGKMVFATHDGEKWVW